MNKLIKTLKVIIVLVICGLIIYYRVPIASFLYKTFLNKKEIVIEESNQYKRDYSFNYIQQTEDFYPKNKQDILNIIYTTLNNGWNQFSFYCGDDYKSCYDDVNTIAHDENIMGYITNFVSPYNSYDTVSLGINKFGKISIQIKYIYSNEEKAILNNKIDQIIKENIKDSMSDYEKIKKIHDYIINTTSYDKNKLKVTVNGITTYKYKSNTAAGPLLNNIALCGGYTDAMALFLDRFNIKNYRIATEQHIWNLVFINNEWKHLDLTWDDPVSNTNKDILTTNFFLITSEQLLSLDKEQHNFNKDIYSEAK